MGRENAERVGPWINTDQYSVPVYTVGPTTPLQHVTLDVDVPSLQAEFDAVPVPAGAQPAAGVDGHMTIYQPSTDTLWEFWVARQAQDGWHARWGGRITRVSTNPGYFEAPFGATATGLPLLGGLITVDELRRGKIDHALAIAVPNTASDAIAWPAQRSDGEAAGPNAIPEGTFFRIDPALDLSTLGLPPAALAIARAAQRYGIVVRDTSSCVVFYAEDPTSLGGDPYGALFEGLYPNQVLEDFPWHALQVVAPRPGV